MNMNFKIFSQLHETAVHVAQLKYTKPCK